MRESESERENERERERERVLETGCDRKLYQVNTIRLSKIDGFVSFRFVSLFNSISTLVGYMPKPPS